MNVNLSATDVGYTNKWLPLNKNRISEMICLIRGWIAGIHRAKYIIRLICYTRLKCNKFDMQASEMANSLQHMHIW